MNYYRITEVSKLSAFYADWPNLVGAVVAAIPERVTRSYLADSFKEIKGMFVRVPPQDGTHLPFNVSETMHQFSVKLHKLSPNERRKIDETRRRAA